MALTSSSCSDNVGPSLSSQRLLFVGSGAGVAVTGAQTIYDIYRVNADGTGLENLTQFPDNYTGLDVTRDGLAVFQVTQSFTSGLVADCPTRIWRMNVDGTQRRPITRGASCSTNPRLSPDDGRIAYQRGNDIFVATLDGAGETLLTAALPAVEPTPCGTTPKVTVQLTGWMDLDRISFWRYICQGTQTWYTVRADGTDLRVVDASSPQTTYLSPDRTRLAYLQDGQLLVRNVDGSGTHTVLSGSVRFGGELASPWSPDGAWLYYVDGASRPSVVSTDGATTRTLREPLNTLFGGWSPDGSRIAWTDYGTAQSSVVVTRSDGTGLVTLPGPGVVNRDARWVGAL